MIRVLLSGIVFLGVSASLPAQEAKSKEAEQAFETLKAEFDAAKEIQKKLQQQLVEDLKKAETAEEKAALRKKVIDAAPEKPFQPKFLAFAEKYADSPVAVNALTIALRSSGGPRMKAGDWSKILKMLETHVQRPEIKGVLRAIAQDDEAGEAFLLNVIAKNNERRVQGAAYMALASTAEMTAKSTARFNEPNIRAQIAKSRGEDFVEQQLKQLPAIKAKAEKYRNIVIEKFGDIFPDLSIGKVVPEVISQDLDGSKTSLTALRGKVVVLDFWATWCGPCRAMIPHEREMVERLKSKSFALVSISADEHKKTLTDFLQKEPMPWQHWWNGSKGGVLEDWNITYFPTIYVVDAQGVIRFKDIRGEELERAVNELLTELESKK